MSLADELRARIEREGPLRVRDFMEACLAEYYGKHARIGGERADFYTASNVSLFPHAMRRFVDAAVERLGGAGVRVVELGGGTGEVAARLARDVIVVEPGASLRAQQEARGLRTVSALGDLPPAPTVLLANEVLDALPVHRVWGTPSGAREGHVDWIDGRFVEVAGRLSPELHGVAVDVGEKLDVNLAQRALLRELAAAAPRCVALFVDYGRAEPARDTLRGFHEHRVTDPFASPGEQDVTADVDFARLAVDARAEGFEVVGPVPQSQLLADLGLVDDLQAALARGDTEAYLAGKSLLMPGMGDRFLAVALVRGAPAEPALAGFRKDLYPGASRR